MRCLSGTAMRWGMLVFTAAAFGCAGSHPRPQPVRHTAVIPVKPVAPVHPIRPKMICWMADGDQMHPAGELEGFPADRLGVSGDCVVIEPVAAVSGYCSDLWRQSRRPVPLRSARMTSDPDGPTSAIGNGGENRWPYTSCG